MWYILWIWDFRGGGIATLNILRPQQNGPYRLLSILKCSLTWFRVSFFVGRKLLLSITNVSTCALFLTICPLLDEKIIVALVYFYMWSCPPCSSAAVAEWLRRWTWNPMGSARVGSNPADRDIFLPVCVCLLCDCISCMGFSFVSDPGR